MVQKENESGVSEIIGVILIVSLTVILTAIVAADMLGMLNGILPFHTIAVTAGKPDSSHIFVIYHGGDDQKSLANLTIIWPSGVSQKIDLPKVGDVYTATNFAAPFNVTSGKDHVVVSAAFTNNVNQVVLNTFV
jgi:FlaG/FlaF family flagellin (archaellin)